MPILIGLLMKILKTKYLWYGLGALLLIFGLHKAVNHYISQYREKTTNAEILKLTQDAMSKDQQLKAIGVIIAQKNVEMQQHKQRADDLQVKADNNEVLYQAALGKLESLEKPANEAKWSLDDCKLAYQNLSDASVQTTTEATKTIEVKTNALKEMSLAFSNCSDASAALTKALSISELKSSDFEKGLDLQQGLTAAIKEEEVKESHRKWWYLIGGLITGDIVSRKIR